jgi:hypothetical protein
MLPKIFSICKQYRKCGKPGCKCNDGALHGPYFFYFYRVDGKLKKKYIRKADAAELWKSYSMQRQVQKQRAADRKEFTELCRNLRRFDRMLSDLSLVETFGGLK